jgi:isochorismate pyruvate lyase
MPDLRESIDQVDRMIVPLLLKRIELISQAGHIKTDRDAVRDDWRIEDVVSKAKAEAEKAGGDTAYIETIYRHLIEYSIEHEFGVWDMVSGGADKSKA